MRKLPAAAFSALVIATVAAFFIAQHLKVATPLLQGSPAPLPVAFDPVYGVHGIDEPKICWTHPPKQTHQVSMPVDYRKTFTTFYLQHQTGHVAVYIVDTSNDIIRTLKSNYDFKRTYVRNPPGAFTWHGKDASGQLAPDGVYYYKVVLLGQDRTVQIGPVRIITTPPRPRVTGVTAIGEPAKAASAGPALISPGTTGASPHKALIHYRRARLPDRLARRPEARLQLRRQRTGPHRGVERPDPRSSGPGRHLPDRPAGNRRSVQRRHLPGRGSPRPRHDARRRGDRPLPRRRGPEHARPRRQQRHRAGRLAPAPVPLGPAPRRRRHARAGAWQRHQRQPERAASAGRTRALRAGDPLRR
jgi:hypothetical protein